ncbi:nuclear transport factor 2 family protein [Pseudonocardia acaciae]|uniref:nuclear transport factor 2 family protein n=1 Tax=Pseudonocardia acaciae TaxID=551276 RepID=UPI001B806C87|nr:nuclear transport factor 2 family protein [Pseudonocardia acaciae]
MTIEQTIERWHRYVRGEPGGDIDALLADDVVFYSPIVYTPQRGKDITRLYLAAALHVLSGDDDRPFRYSKQVVAGDTAVLEFETNLDGTYVNGVDIIRCDDAGRIVEFRVMVRPLQAVNAVHQRMKAMLDAAQQA